MSGLMEINNGCKSGHKLLVWFCPHKFQMVWEWWWKWF